MKVSHNINKLSINRNKKVYICSTCDELFNWSKDSSWYGSYKDLELNPDKIEYYCSDKCLKNYERI